MRFFRNILLILFCFCLCMPLANAQILDDSAIDSDDDEELFNDIFSDYSEEEKDITKTHSFDDVIDQASDVLRKANLESEEDENTIEESAPLEGELFVGVNKGSFRTYSTIKGKTACTFDVTLKSTLNRDIKSMGFYLIYPKRTFAFMFLDLRSNTAQRHSIRTSGAICYNLVGVPDINVHKCKIYGTSSKECTTRLKWDENITDEVDTPK